MNFLTRRFLEFLKQGLSPEKLALCVALGVTLGIFPVLGSTTALCVIVGLMLGLNQPAMQSVNYLVYPLQLILLIPFYRLGEFVFRESPISISLSELRDHITQDWIGAIRLLWTTTWHAMVVWCVLAPFLVSLLYYTLRPLLQRLSHRLTH